MRSRSSPSEDVLFELPEYPEKRIVFDADGVRERLARIISATT